MHRHQFDIIAASRRAPLIQNIMLLLARHGMQLVSSRIKLSEPALPEWSIETVVPSSFNAATSSVSRFIHDIEHYGHTVTRHDTCAISPYFHQENQYVMTLISPQTLCEADLCQITRLITESSLEKTVSLGARAAQIIFTHNENQPEKLCRNLQEQAQKMGIDLITRKASDCQRSMQLAVFDMDSTLIQAEVIDEMANEAGKKTEVAAMTEMAMRGEINFNTSLEKRLALLKGLPEKALAGVFERIRLSPGAKRLLNVLHALDCHTAIVSGGFNWFAKQFQNTLHIHQVFANELEFQNGKLTGRVTGRVVDSTVKKQTLQELMSGRNIPRENTLAVGDGANDIPMLESAGLGVAFHPKPALREKINAVLSHGGLDSILYLAGWHDEEIGHILETA